MSTDCPIPHIRKRDGRVLHIRVRKVRGVRKDESDALIRLADALCGFVRGAVEGQEAMQGLLEQGKRTGFLKEL